MPSFTKKAIIETFLLLASKKSLEKITVRDIVDACGVNRNTFYYYFQDIYAVLEDICAQGLERIPRGLPIEQTLPAAFSALAMLTEHHKKVMRGIAISMGIDGAERYFAAGLDALFAQSVAISAPDAPSLYPSLLRHAFLGVFIDWLRAEHPADPAEIEQQLAEIGKLLMGRAE